MLNPLPRWRRRLGHGAWGMERWRCVCHQGFAVLQRWGKIDRFTILIIYDVYFRTYAKWNERRGRGNATAKLCVLPSTPETPRPNLYVYIKAYIYIYICTRCTVFPGICQPGAGVTWLATIWPQSMAADSFGYAIAIASTHRPENTH